MFDRVLHGEDVRGPPRCESIIEASGGLAGAGRAHHEDEAALLHDEGGEHRGSRRCAIFDVGSP
jgi:hypothetical protein